MEINLKEDEKIYITSDGTNNHAELLIKGKNILITNYNFNINQVIVIKRKNYIIKTFLFESKDDYDLFDFGNWSDCTELFNSLNLFDNESNRSNCSRN